MPYIFQEEIKKIQPHKTGCEAFDSMYHLYTIFKDSSYFLVNLFLSPNEKLNLQKILSFLKKSSKKYNVSHWVVRCKQNIENQPVEAVAFANTSEPLNMQKCAEYILQRTSQGYDCIVHEVIVGPYPSNRLDWLYSFGIYFKNSLPQIEIYPATDASSIKWGKLSPLDIITIDSQLDTTHHNIRDEISVTTYQHAKISEWIQLFKKEINESFPDKKLFTNAHSLRQLLIERKHPLFDLTKIDMAIQNTKDELIKIALKYSLYAQQNQRNPDQTIIHGSLLFNNRMIIWDISTDKRWQHIKSQ